MTEQDYSAEMVTWEQERLDFLRNPEGYLSLVGLCWLHEGVNQIGSDHSNDCIFPRGLPAHMGMITVENGTFYLSLADGVAATVAGEPVRTVQLFADMDAAGPTIVQQGTISWFVIKRGDALGIRIRDAHSQTLQRFEGVARYAVDREWRVSAEFIPHETPRTVAVPTILGTPADMISPGSVRLTVKGHTQALVALKSGKRNRLFLIVADETSGKESYGGGRFLTTEEIDADNRVVVDFNKATNPPCAFSPYATCPRPPAENRLPLPIQAGEKTYHYTL